MNACARHTHCACVFLESMSVLKLAERCVAEPLPHFEDAEQLIADDYCNHASDSVHEDDSCGNGDEDSIGETSPTGAARKSFMDPCEVDLEEVRDVKEFSSATCKCTNREGGPCSSYFSVEEFADHRMQMAELEHDALDIIILSQINAHHFSEGDNGSSPSFYQHFHVPYVWQPSCFYME